MLKKMMLLASMAVAAVAFAIPAVASADWTDGTAKVETEREVTFSGTAQFTSAIGGVHCSEATSTTTLEPGTTGTVDTFSPVVASCKGTGGLAGCKVTTAESTGLPWTAHTTGEKIAITGVHIDNTFHGAFCPYHELTLTGTALATPDSAHAATSGTLSSTATSGSGETHVPAGLEAYNGTTGATVSTISASGTLSVTPSGTYGIT